MAESVRIRFAALSRLPALLAGRGKTLAVVAGLGLALTACDADGGKNDDRPDTGILSDTSGGVKPGSDTGVTDGTGEGDDAGDPEVMQKPATPVVTSPDTSKGPGVQTVEMTGTYESGNTDSIVIAEPGREDIAPMNATLHPDGTFNAFVPVPSRCIAVAYNAAGSSPESAPFTVEFVHPGAPEPEAESTDLKITQSSLPVDLTVAPGVSAVNAYDSNGDAVIDGFPVPAGDTHVQVVLQASNGKYLDSLYTFTPLYLFEGEMTEGEGGTLEVNYAAPVMGRVELDCSQHSAEDGTQYCGASGTAASPFIYPVTLNVSDLESCVATAENMTDDKFGAGSVTPCEVEDGIASFDYNSGGTTGGTVIKITVTGTGAPGADGLPRQVQRDLSFLLNQKLVLEGDE